jgi:hypothetical protein
MTMLRYTGTVATNFAAPRLAGIEPGDVFGVPDDEAETYLRRGDVELADLAEDEAAKEALPSGQEAPESASPPEEAAAPETSAPAEPAE